MSSPILHSASNNNIENFGSMNSSDQTPPKINSGINGTSAWLQNVNQSVKKGSYI
jgi:hypothetical protein